MTNLVKQHAPPKPLFQTHMNPNMGIPEYSNNLKNDKSVKNIIQTWYTNSPSSKKKKSPKKLKEKKLEKRVIREPTDDEVRASLI